nr:hypothetical protein [Candidatus Magasanikbacteria bacterium]
MFFGIKNNLKKKLVSGLVTVVVATQVLGVLVPVPVHAIPVEDFALQAQALQDYLERQVDKVDTTFTNTLRISALTSLMNGVTYFMRKLAYDAATYIATAGPGQKPLFSQDNFGDYITATAGDAVGEAVGDLGKPFGLNLCQLPDIRLQVFLQIGLRDIYGQGEPKPSCSWQQLSDTWGDPGKYLAQFGDPKYLAEHFSANLSVKNSDFGFAMGAIGRVDALQASAVAGATNQRLEGSGINAVTDLITKKIKTPAELVQEDLNQLSAKEQQELSFGQLAGVYADASPQLLLTAGNVFLNTLASKVLKRLLTEGLVPTTPNASQSVADFFGVVQNNRQAVQQVFSELFVPPVGSSATYDAVNNFSSCPDAPATFALDNCVMDKDLRAAIDRARREKAPLTIAEAIAEGLLHGDRSLIPPTNEVKNTDRNCYKDAYCYSNIQKMRKARILPLGFEIAALQADPSNPPKLETVVNGFYDCNLQGLADSAHPYCHLINPNWILKAPEELCHTFATGPGLIDPSSSGRRQECMDLATCVLEDEEGRCIGNKFGFCTQEKNIWRLGGETCPAQFNTCKTFVNTESGTQVSYLSKTMDFGQCNVDTVGCRAYTTDKDIANLSASDPWIPSTRAVSADDRRLGRTAALYFNKNSQTTDAQCASGSDGCTAFYGAKLNDDGTYVIDGSTNNFSENTSLSAGELTHLKKAPDYLGCYDANSRTTEIDWPNTSAEASDLTVRAPAACQSFASVCVQSEVGCESYTPSVGGSQIAIPGIVGGNRCDAACVGYDTFRELGRAETGQGFDTGAFPVYFIAPGPGANTNARTCTARAAGCDEFTNIDARGNSGEKLEYYTSLKYCEKPLADGSNQRAFYSWEGSRTEGYVLRVHRLLPINSAEQTYLNNVNPSLGIQTVASVFPINSPAYDDDTNSVIEGYYNICNATLYANRVNTNGTGELPNGGTVPISDINCRELYDDQGTTFYRLINHTVTVDASCHPLRKTITNLVADPAITGANAQTICTETRNGAQRGVWEDNTCRRCSAGGWFVPSATAANGGFCQYQTISSPGESESCSAAMNGCRAYVGNTGNNRQIVFTDTFEPQGSSASALVAANPGWDDNNSNFPFGAATSTGITISGEALRVTEHSLYVHFQSGVDSSAARYIPGNTLRANATYELTFWARSAIPQTLGIHLEQRSAPGFVGGLRGEFTRDALTNASAPVSLSGSWQQYHVGPVVFTGQGGSPASSTLPAYLIFEVSREGEYFIDNVELTQLQDRVYLIKDSWKQTVNYNGVDTLVDVPLACDAKPTDSLPGAALGCTAYKDSQSATVYTTGFESLCRVEAVGCKPLWDTHNTVDDEYGTDGGEYLQAYNLWCDSTNSSVAIRSQAGDRCTLRSGFIKIGQPETGSCAIPQGQTGCIIPERLIFTTGSPDDATIIPSTIIIPADTPSSTPIFLADRKQFECDSKDLGCMELGRETPTLPNNAASTHEKVFIKNNPELYVVPGGPGMLCSQPVAGCTEFDAIGGSPVFAKDPVFTGGGTCTYKPTVERNNTTYSGWFKDGVGECSQNNNTLCRVDGDCGTGNTCVNIGDVPCDSTYLNRTGGQLIYDIRSNADAAYQGTVGVCPASENTCTELVDPTDVTNIYPNGHPYYVLYNKQLSDKAKECNGQVSLTEGCALFDKTEDPAKLYNAADTYAVSERSTPPFKLVSPVGASSATNNNANVILKVDRDRTCSQWLACKSSTIETGVNGNPNPVPLCYEYKLCDATSADAEGCTHWVPDGGEPFAGQLDQQSYVARDVSWQGSDYSGYSLFNKYQIGDLDYVKFDLSDFNTLRSEGFGGTSYAAHRLTAGDSDCTGTRTRPDTSWDACGPVDITPGRCYGGRCLVPIIGSLPESAGIPNQILEATPALTDDQKTDAVRKILGYFTGGTCKAYPEKDSPFPYQVATDKRQKSDDALNNPKTRDIFIEKKTGFTGATVCQRADGQDTVGDCSCSYEKVSYKGGGTVDYWPLRASSKVPQGICVGGQSDGIPCDPEGDAAQCGGSGSSDLIAAGTCQPVDKRQKVLGLSGYCLERDLSHPINGLADASKNEVQQYACLTWLPIDISASDANFFNSAESAGYLPRMDSMGRAGTAEGGQIYCAAGTRVNNYINGGSGLFTRSLTGGITPINQLINDYFGSTGYFLDGNDSGKARLPVPILSSGEVYSENCDGDFAPYKAFGCDNQPAANSDWTHYQVMQTWAWGALGDDGRRSLVLRVEKPQPRNGSDTFIGVASRNGTNGATYTDVQHFLPAPRAQDNATYGTVMHPPRTWGSTANFTNGVPNPTFVDSLEYSQEDIGPNPHLNILATGYSPDAEFRGGLQSDFMTQSSAERTIRETDIDKIYFVPTAFPGKAGGVNPNLLSKQLYIDFSLLNKLSTPARLSTNIDSIWDEQDCFPSCSNMGYYFPDNRDFPSSQNGTRQSLQAYLWTYKQVAPNITSHATYPSGIIPEDRNVIAKRYVAVYFADFDDENDEVKNDGSHLPAFVPVDLSSADRRPVAIVPDSNPSNQGSAPNDPFKEDEVTCGVGRENWFAIGMDFNSQGEFLGYITRWCFGHTGREEPNGIMMSVVATLNDQCSEFAKVYESNQSGISEGTNKAWTNRVWAGATGNNPGPVATNVNGPLAHPERGYTSINFLRSYINQPFGSLTLDDIPSDFNLLRNYSFRNQPTIPVPQGADMSLPFDGVPFACTAQW